MAHALSPAPLADGPMGPHSAALCRTDARSSSEGPGVTGSLQALHLIVTVGTCQITVQDPLSNLGIMLFTAKEAAAEGLGALPGVTGLLMSEPVGTRQQVSWAPDPCPPGQSPAPPPRVSFSSR